MQSRFIGRAMAQLCAHVGPPVLWAALASSAVACSQPQDHGSEAKPAPPPKSSPKRDTVVESAVTWPARSTLDERARLALPSKALSAVDRSPVPVLVVARSELLESSTVLTKSAWYALSTRGDGVTVSLHANHVAHRYPRTPKVTGTQRVRGQHAFVTQNEGIWSAAWVEGGAAYSLEVECATPSDARCTDASYLMSLAEDLRYVGGAGAESAP